MDLQVDARPVGHRFVVALSGIADLSTIALLQHRLRRAVADHPDTEVVIDLDGLTVIDDSALGLFLGAAAAARQGGGDLVVVSTDERIRARLTATRLDRAIEVRTSLS